MKGLYTTMKRFLFLLVMLAILFKFFQLKRRQGDETGVFMFKGRRDKDREIEKEREREILLHLT